MITTNKGDLGKLKGYIKFRCNKCNCEFIADNTEYKYHDTQYGDIWYEVICPCCGKNNSSEKLTKYDTTPEEYKNNKDLADTKIDTIISNSKELKSIKIDNHIFNLPKPITVDLKELNSMKTEEAILYLICKALFEEETNEN